MQTPGAIAEPVRALAEADFGGFAQRFADAGFTVGLPATGIMTLRSGAAPACASVLVSVGVHGDETGPIEVLAHVLDALSREPRALVVDLMVCVGNVAAIAAGKRFIDADLNRMFRPARGSLAGTAEAARADELIDATGAFFDGAGPDRWHLDLHTAIRPSVYPTFAIVPDLIAKEGKCALVSWLEQAAIGAIIMNPQSAGTFSYFSAEFHGAAASTVELGRVGTLGQNDLSQFADVGTALDRLLRGGAPGAGDHQAVRRVQDDLWPRHAKLHRPAPGRRNRHRWRHGLHGQACRGAGCIPQSRRARGPAGRLDGGTRRTSLTDLVFSP